MGAFISGLLLGIIGTSVGLAVLLHKFTDGEIWSVIFGGREGRSSEYGEQAVDSTPETTFDPFASNYVPPGQSGRQHGDPLL